MRRFLSFFVATMGGEEEGECEGEVGVASLVNADGEVGGRESDSDDDDDGDDGDNDGDDGLSDANTSDADVMSDVFILCTFLTLSRRRACSCVDAVCCCMTSCSSCS